jgi:thioesterase domain-containing protein
MGKPIPAKLRSFYIVDKYMRYSDCYQPKPYTNKLHMITAQSNMDTVDPYLGWRKFVKNKIELIHLPGNHREMVKNPEVAKMLAEKIKNIILNLK